MGQSERRLQPGRAPAPVQGLNFKWVALATVGAVAYCAALPWLTMQYGTPNPSVGYLQFGPLAILAVLCWLVAPLLRRVHEPAGTLIPAALLFYALAVSLGGFATNFTVMQIPPNVTAPTYFATPENRFNTEVLPLLPDTLIIKNEVAARGFYEGARQGGIPWSLWVGPLVRWGTLAFLYLITSVCMLGIFRTRWIEHERLPFPLAEIPLFVAGHGHFGMARDDPRMRNKLLQIGLLAALSFQSYNALHYYIPALPQIPMSFNCRGLFTSRPWDVLAGGYWPNVSVRISLLAIAYLMPSAMALGIFGFYFLLLGIMVISRYFGDPTLGPLNFNPWASGIHHQAGAYCGLLLFAAWSSRSDLARMAAGLWRAFTGEPQGREHPDRWMLLGFVVGLGAMCWWSVSAGISLWVALAFLLAALALTFGFSLITAQSGLPILQIDNIPQQMLTAFVKPKVLGLKNLAMIGIFDRLFSWYKQHASMPSALQGLKIADTERIPDRSLMAALLIAGAVVIAANCTSLLHLAYDKGLYINATTYYHVETMNMPHYPIRWAQRALADPEPQLNYHWMILGAISMWVVQILYREFVWWPVHPLGMLLPVGCQIIGQWFSVLVGWGIGRLITRYAGPKAYVTMRPLFLGLVLGDAAAAALWLVIDLLAGTRGHGIPTIW